MTTRRARREHLLESDLSIHPRRSPRLSQRYSSQPPEMTSSHPLVQSRRSLRPSASVEPSSILDESGQSVPPCFYGDMPEQPVKEADGPLHSHTLQHGLPEHLYGLDDSDSSDEQSSHAGTPQQSITFPPPDLSTPLQTPGPHHPRPQAKGVCHQVLRFFTSVLFKCGSLLYLAATTVLCLDVILLHRLFHSGVSTKSLARFWILPLILLAVMLLLLRGGVPDNDWNEPAPIWPKEPGNLQERIFREVALNLRKDIGLFQSALRNEMEAYVEKLVREGLANSEIQLERTISTMVYGEAKTRQTFLTHLKENIWKELNSSLEFHTKELLTIVKNKIDTQTDQFEAEKLDWISQDSFLQAIDSIKQEIQGAVEGLASDLHQKMGAIESRIEDNASAVNGELLDIQRKQQTSISDLTSLIKRVDLHGEQIAALEQKYHDILVEISSFKHSYLIRLDELEKTQNVSLNSSAVMKLFYGELDKVLANTSSSLRLWLEQSFVSSKEFLSSGSGEVTRKDVRQMIDLSLAKYSADRIGKFDFALENSGGSVLLDMCSKTYTPSLATVSLFGFSLWHVATTPKVIIQPQVYPGDCWAFEGSTGYATIKLKDTVLITGATIEHIPKELSPNGSLDSAPKDIMLVGLESLEDDGEQLGIFEYSLDGNVIQQFEVNLQNSRAFQFVQFRFLSNHGHPEYTCVYRVRVHGQYM